MMGILPETTRVRTPVILLAILMACVAFLGFSYWTEYARSHSYQKRITFLEGAISKVAVEEEEADGREKDFQRELKRQKAKEAQMNALLNTEVSKISNRFQLEKNHLLHNLEVKDSIIKEKEALLDGLKKDYQTLQHQMEIFQKNQSLLLDKFTLQSERVRMVLRLKKLCYDQMNNIARASLKPVRPTETGSDKERPRTTDKDQAKENREASIKGATPSPKIGSEHSNISSDSAKESDIVIKTLKGILSAPPLRPINISVNTHLEKKNEEPIDEKVDQKPPTDTTTQTLKRKEGAPPIEKNDKVMPPLDEDDEEPTDEDVNQKPSTKTTTQTLKRKEGAPPIEEKNKKVIPPLEEEEEKPTDEDVNQKPSTDTATQTLKRNDPAAPVEKKNNKALLPLEKADEEPIKKEVPASIPQNPSTHQPEDKQDSLTYKQGKEAEEKLDVEPF